MNSDKEITLSLLCPSPSEQIRSMNYKFKGDLVNLDKCNDAINLLYMQSILNDTEYKKARQKLMNKILKGLVKNEK